MTRTPLRRTPWRWAWLAPVGAVLVAIEAIRLSGGAPPIPFLSLFTVVVVAALGGGAGPGAVAGLTGGAYVLFSALIGFGPQSLTGHVPNALVGAAIFLGVPIAIGRLVDRTAQRLRELRAREARLEAEIANRIRDIERANHDLRAEMARRAHSEARLRHAQRLESLGVLAGGIAHDFNNLLTRMIGNADLIRTVTSEPDVAALAGEVLHAADRAADLVQQMLTYAGQGTREQELVDLRDLVQEMVHLLAASNLRKGTMTLDVPPGATVRGSPTQLRQLVLNLVTNAAEATPSDGRIRITATRGAPQADHPSGWLGVVPDDPLILTVSDTGTGMNEDALTHVFEPFFTQKEGGRGLGMSVVLGVVQGHGGAIRIRSTEGEGTAVDVALPAAQPASRPPASDRATPPATPTIPRGALLVADDEPAIRALVRKFVEPLGYHVVEATNGDEAVAIFDRRTDWVGAIVDRTMPGRDGTAVAGNIRGRQADLHVVLMSGYIAHEEAQGPFLPKPFTRRALLEALRIADAGEPAE